MMRKDVRSIAIFSREVGRATDYLAPNLCFHVNCGDVAIQVILRHVLIAAVLALILLDVRVRIHMVIQLRLCEVP